MKILTLNAKLTCKHVTGIVRLDNTQSMVRISGHPVLVAIDPELKRIDFCPNLGMNIKPCQLTLKVRQGYSSFIRIQGRQVCLDTVIGLTDGTPPGTVDYMVRFPGQTFVSGAG